MPAKKDSSHVLRLLPGADLKGAIQDFVNKKDIKAGWIVSCAGSLIEYSIRFANQPAAFKDTGHFEIVSLSGTVSISGSHLHISISDSNGKTIGGHLMEGCKVYTTAEIVLIESGKYIFARERDGSTSWRELQVTKK